MRRRSMIHPADPAPRTISGKGTCRKKMPANAAAASATSARSFSARRPMRITASITTAMIAGFSPKNSAATSAVLRYAA
jgi:hypothetical protein